MSINPNTTLSPPSAEDQRRSGWLAQRSAAVKERAESALWAEALRTGRKQRGGTVTFTLPRDLSSGADDAPKDEHGREIVTVTLPHTVTADPADRWSERQLVSAANRACLKARSRIRPKPDRDTALDTAGALVMAILDRRFGTLPLRSDVTGAYLEQRAHGMMIDALGRGTVEDATVSAADVVDVADVAALVDASERQRAQRDRDPMLDVSVSPLSAEDQRAADRLGLAERERDAIGSLLAGERHADRAERNGRTVNTERQRHARALAHLTATYSPEHLRSAYRGARSAERTEQERRAWAARSAVAMIQEAPAPSTHGKRLTWPERTQPEEAAPITYRRMD